MVSQSKYGRNKDSTSSGGKEEKKRQTFYIRADLIEKIRGYAYWERLGISEVVNVGLEQFFLGKKVKPIPERK